MQSKKPIAFIIMKKIIKTFESSDKKQSLEFYLVYDSSNDTDITNLVISVLDSKSSKIVDLTDLFESNKELWAIADTIIDNMIKAQ
jgi:hypothetical protein